MSSSEETCRLRDTLIAALCKVKAFRNTHCNDALKFYGKVTVGKGDIHDYYIFNINNLSDFENIVNFVLNITHRATQLQSETNNQNIVALSKPLLLVSYKTTCNRPQQLETTAHKDHQEAAGCWQRLKNVFN